ncbi:short chain dehydrogenase [Phormidium tenue FACHB-886]|nr:short chain dehydrogenase [Phormidium tenue FACHB-886]
MKILIVGAGGTLGKHLASQFSNKHQIISAGRSSGDVYVDIRSKITIERMYREIDSVDACVCVAESGALDDFENLTDEQLLENMRGKFFGQVNLVLIGKEYLADNGSFTLTSGIFADEPWKGVTGGGVVSGALHSFVLSAAIELKRGLRINVVSPSIIENSVTTYGHLFPGMKAVSMDSLTDAYTRCVEGKGTGEIVRVYR